MILVCLLQVQQIYSTGITSSRSVTVVGAGVGGLVSAARLAQAGVPVTLLEKSPTCGGRMQSEVIGAYRCVLCIIQNHCHCVLYSILRFDVGPSLLLLPHVYRDTFSMLGQLSFIIIYFVLHLYV